MRIEYIEHPTDYQLQWKGWTWRTMDGEKWVWARKDKWGMRSHLFLDQRGIDDLRESKWRDAVKTN